MDNPVIPSAAEAAQFIWREQDLLNAASHPTKRGTINDGTRPAADVATIEFDYYLALHDEIAELINNFIWKHWSKESRDGKRYQLIHPDQEAGEGSAQNVAVELIDIVFFTVSLFHNRKTATVSPGPYVMGSKKDEEIVDTWKNIWGSEDIWAASQLLSDAHVPTSKRVRNQARLQDVNNNKLLLHQLVDFEKSIQSKDAMAAISTLILLFTLAGISWEDALRLYKQKLAINYERMNRGRKQIGDVVAHTENEGVK